MAGSGACPACGLFHGAEECARLADARRVQVADEQMRRALMDFARAGEKLGLLYGRRLPAGVVALTLTVASVEAWNKAWAAFQTATKAYMAVMDPLVAKARQENRLEPPAERPHVPDDDPHKVIAIED